MTSSPSQISYKPKKAGNHVLLFFTTLVRTYAKTLIFLNPLLGLAVGASAGAVSGALTDVGIDDNFMKELAGTMQPGNSALFILVRRSTPDKVLEELKGTGGKVLKTSLSHDDEAKLQDALSAAKQ